MPNPRIWKATIAARLCEVELDVRGARSGELGDWLWDFDARPHFWHLRVAITKWGIDHGRRS